MPTLHWIGKDKVINHHINVPFRVLEHKYTAPQPPERGVCEAGNKIIHGDNLDALKALLPEYEGRINCIYIDPPYNTGNEGWVYNDNVNDPKIRKWLGQVVGKEAEDLTRHDKWLCMMYPRLKLLHKLLADDGAIFISIDDNEQANLKLICDEIFGGGNFVANIVWRRRKSQANLSKNISPIHDFIVCYSKSKETTLNKISPNINESDFKNPDNDERGPYVTMPSTNKGGSKYSIITPTGLTIEDEWRFKEDTFKKLLSENRLVFPKNGNGKPRYKLFLNEKLIDGVIPNTWWDDDSSNQEATLELKSIFQDKSFDTPKPTKLIVKVISLISDKNSIILDSFAGSGTTAHAVLNLNKQDGGNRKFILVEMEDYAESITAERVKRVMNGYGSAGSPTAEGTGGSFDYYELGEPLFLENGNLNEKIEIEKIRNYIWYSETQKPSLSLTLSKGEGNEGNSAFLGVNNDTAYYFHYLKDEITTLNHDFLAGIKTKAEQYVIYADNCVLTKAFMTKYHIIFKKIPRDITRF
ncbi:MAG: site-specific DNA-methyltransferase [Paludibacter sp.]|jgi:adenine-specific DNA-methyltransferase|nr:site-specific DNA-methyltransferase [Paludibacter sp.]